MITCQDYSVKFATLRAAEPFQFDQYQGPKMTYIFDQGFEPWVYKVLWFDIPIIVAVQEHDAGIWLVFCQMSQVLERGGVQS